MANSSGRSLLRREIVEGGQQLPRSQIAGSAKDHHDAAIRTRPSVCSARCAAAFMPLFRGVLFHVPAELLPHGREHFLSERVVLTGAEADVKRGGQDIGGNGFFEGGLMVQRPSPESCTKPV